MNGSLETLRQAWRLLVAHKLRSALTLFGVVWGTASVIFLVGWGEGVSKMLEDGFSRAGKDMGHVWAGRVSEDFSPAVDRRILWFTTDDLEVVRRRARLPELIAGEARRYTAAAFRQRGRNAEVRGVEPEGMVIRGAVLAGGRPIRPSDLEHRRRVAILGHDMRRDLLGAEGRIGNWVRLGGTPFRIIGVLERVGTQLSRDGAPIDDQIWIPLTTHLVHFANPVLNEPILNTLIFQLRGRKLLDPTRHEIRAILAEQLRVSPTDTEAISIWSAVELLNRMPANRQRGLMILVAGATLMISGIGIMSMMLDSVRERRPEIGVCLAVGATRRAILVEFFLETFAVVAIGGLLGVALGSLLTLAMASIDVPDLVPVPIYSWSAVVASLVVMGTVGVLAGLVPAWRASRIDPAETLRAE
ncbi:MAG: ABC transporter permease [bacterium]|nr:ABC transporter permease [bacterium]